jgi:hypothetical protein
MPKVSEVYTQDSTSKKFLIAADVQKPLSLTITTAETKEIKNEKKIVLSFKEIEYQLPLNATNAGTMKEKFGDDSKSWIGETIQIASVPTKFQGQTTKGLRIL